MQHKENDTEPKDINPNVTLSQRTLGGLWHKAEGDISPNNINWNATLTQMQHKLFQATEAWDIKLFFKLLTHGLNGYLSIHWYMGYNHIVVIQQKE